MLADVRMCVCVLVPFYSIRKVSHPVTVAKIVQLVSIRDGEAWLRKNKKRKIVSQIFEMSFGRKKGVELPGSVARAC